MNTIVRMHTENNISITQSLHLSDYFRMEQKAGHFIDFDFSDISWIDLTEAQRKRIWSLIYNTHAEQNKDLINMLFQIGVKVAK